MPQRKRAEKSKTRLQDQEGDGRELDEIVASGSKPDLVGTGQPSRSGTGGNLPEGPTSPRLVRTGAWQHLGGIWEFDPSGVDSEGKYLVQGTPFNKEILAIDPHVSIQVSRKAKEKLLHFHPVTSEIYVFLEWTGTFEVSSRTSAYRGFESAWSRIELNVLPGNPRILYVPPDHCHRLNGSGLLIVFKAPARPGGVGVESQKVPCKKCVHRVDCVLKETIGHQD